MPDYKQRLKELKSRSLSTTERIVVCKHCGYPWICDSILAIVTCPSCSGKTPSNMETKP